MKVIFSISFFVIGLFNTFCQITDVSEKFLLPPSLEESSGAIFFNSKLITHNDSGGENKLYELDTISGQVTRTVTINNATNIDWEDITQDDNSIYIADIGNNNGDRTNLKIYKVSKTDYANSININAEIISYNYADQTDFVTNPNNTIWDAEALISFDSNNLIVFTKNWIDGITKGYLIPKTPGTYSINPLPTTLNSQALITGSTFNPFTGVLYLIGYTELLSPIIWACHNFSTNDIFSGINTQKVLSTLGQKQVEAITFVDTNRYLITSETFFRTLGAFTFSSDAKLISFSTNDDALLNINTTTEEKHDVVLHPNPVKDVLKVKGLGLTSIKIFDTKFTQLYSGNDTLIDMSSFSQGFYIVKIELQSKRTIIKKIIKK